VTGPADASLPGFLRLAGRLQICVVASFTGPLSACGQVFPQAVDNRHEQCRSNHSAGTQFRRKIAAKLEVKAE
jgi:hypothetical protein